MKQYSTKAASYRDDFNRRDFLRGTSMATMAAMMGGVRLVAADAPAAGADAAASKKPPVNCAVIGLGIQGRDILTVLSKLPNAPVVAICDTYEAMVNRSKQLAPKAEGYSDYKQVLANKEVKAVIVATPTHKHREIVEAALAAGKHVYCEAPIAHTMEDARAIAQAARKSLRLNFQAGLQRRADPQYPFTLKFLRAGAAGNFVSARSQWHKKTSWKRTSPNEEREKELNWRLYNSTSTGLLGEIGIHQVDVVSWYLKAKPVAVSGWGSIQLYTDDGRETFDTIQAMFEFPGKVNYFYDATLANSFEGEYDVFYGKDAAVMLRGGDAWMFKEADAPLLGWEVYCKKEEGVAYKEAGLSMRSDATKISAQGKQAERPAYSITSLTSSLETFLLNTNTISAGMEDYDLMGGDPKDEKALKEYLDGDALKKARVPAAGWEEGYQSAVMVIKANESIVKGTKITFSNEWFQL